MTQNGKRQKLGYRLAAERFYSTGHDTLKTIKFPITSRNHSFDQKLVASIKHDYQLMYGSLNYPDYVEQPNRYSLLDFWVDSLRAGVLWAKSFSSAEALLLALRNRPSFQQTLAKNLRDSITAKMDISLEKVAVDRIAERLQSAPRNIKSLSQLKTEFEKNFSFAKDDQSEDRTRILTHIEQAITTVPTNGVEFYQQFFEFFGSPALLPKYNTYISHPYTFIFNPDWKLDEHNNDTPQQLVIRLNELFGEQAPAVMGLKDNFNGLQNYCNDFLSTLLAGDVEKVLDSMLATNPDYHKQDIEQRLLWLAERAKQLGSNSIQLGNTAADLRTDFGAALASWVANFSRSSNAIVFDLSKKHLELKKLKNEIARQDEDERSHELLHLIDELRSISEKYSYAEQKEEVSSAEKIFKSNRLGDKEAKEEVVRRVAELQKKLSSADLLQYKQLLSDLRYKANQYYQQVIWPQKKDSVQKDGKQISAGETFQKQYKLIFKELPELPAFIGDVKRSKFEKYTSGLSTLDAGLKTIEKYLEILQQQPADSSLSTVKSLKAAIKSLATKVSTQSYQGEFAQVAREILIKYLTTDMVEDVLAGNAHKYDFYETVYYKSRKKLAEYTYDFDHSNPHQELEAMYKKLLALCKPDLNSYYLKNEQKLNSDALRASIETWKSALAFFCKTRKVVDIEVTTQDFQFSEAAVSYLDRVSTGSEKLSLTLERFNFLMQIGVFSELKGLINVLSLEKTISRYVVQTMNGGQQELEYVPVNKEQEKILYSPPPSELVETVKQFRSNGDGYLDYLADSVPSEHVSKHLFYYPHEYALSIKNHTQKGQDRVVSMNKKSLGSSFNLKKKLDQNTLFYLHSSRYQTQFLEWFLHTPKTKKIDLDMAGGSLICEVPVRHIIKQQSDGSLRTEYSEDLDKARLFSSMPFSMNAEQSIRNQHSFIFKNARKLKTSKIEVGYALPQRFIGIDLGEYGLAYSIIELPQSAYEAILENPYSVGRSSNDYCKSHIASVKVLDSGYIFEPGLEKIRQGVKQLKQKQVLATFTSQETYLARLRENVSKTLRNKVHSLALAHQAKIVYEGSVTAFEAGGNRIAKLYKTIKTPDILGSERSDADQSAMKNIWGSDSLRIASEISAVDTSQSSLKSRMTYKDVIEENNEYSVKILAKTKNLKDQDVYSVSVKVEKNKTVYLPLATFQYERVVSDNIISGKALLAACKEALRPSRNQITLEEQKELEAKFADLWNQENRGNSYIYRDLFEQNYFEDADIQAAINIALRGIVKECVFTNQDLKFGADTPIPSILRHENESLYQSVSIIR